MRNITEIVLHNSASKSQKLSIDKFQKQIEAWHRKAFRNNPDSKSYFTQYHYLVAGDGTVRNARPVEDIGWHCGDWKVNKSSIAICMAGDFREDELEGKQLKAVTKLVDTLKKDYGIKANNVKGHRNYKATVCPGTNITDEMIVKIARGDYIGKTDKMPSWAMDSWDKAVKKGIAPDDPYQIVNIKLMQEILKRAGVIKKVDDLPSYRMIKILEKLNKL